MLAEKKIETLDAMLYELEEYFCSNVLTDKNSLFTLNAIVQYLDTILISYSRIYCCDVYKSDKSKLELVNNIFTYHIV
jgi:hypothetical protein